MRHSLSRGPAVVVDVAAPRLGADRGLAAGGSGRSLRDGRRGRAHRPVPAADGRLRPTREAGAGVAHAGRALPRHRRLRRTLRRSGLDATARRVAEDSQPGDDDRAAVRESRRSSSTASRSRSCSSSASTRRSSVATSLPGRAAGRTSSWTKPIPSCCCRHSRRSPSSPSSAWSFRTATRSCRRARHIREAVTDALPSLRTTLDLGGGVFLSFYCARELEREEVCVQRGEASQSWGWPAWRSSWSPPVAANRSRARAVPPRHRPGPRRSVSTISRRTSRR